MSRTDMKVVDLFCGCSGLGLGARQAGFSVAASIDVDPILTSSYKLNFPEGGLHLGDITQLEGKALSMIAGGHVDGIIGGPPCQGFSEIGRADPEDPRRHLLYHYFRLVSEVRPRFFLMENVRGLTNHKNMPFLEAALQLVVDRYEILGPVLVDGSEHGAATKRPRIFIVGYDKRYVDDFDQNQFIGEKSAPSTVEAAISDLASAVSIGEVDGFDSWKLPENVSASKYARGLMSNDCKTTGHRRTVHRGEIADRFSSIPQGAIDPIGRHPRLSWSGQCPTIRAGTGPDKGSRQAVRPLHPEEPRVITVREAARLQGFPDWFKFHPTVWHSFRMIGNSVSPIVSKKLLSSIYARMASNRDLLAAE